MVVSTSYPYKNSQGFVKVTFFLSVAGRSLIFSSLDKEDVRVIYTIGTTRNFL